MFLQANVHPMLITHSPLEGLAIPNQLQALQSAAHFAAVAEFGISLGHVTHLLAQLCHPEASQRMSAAAVADIDWVRDAAAKPLPACPMSISCLTV